MKEKRQEKRIEAYLNLHGSINPLEAWRSCGVYRLSDVIYKLRKRGMIITTLTTNACNQFGETVRFTEYRIVQ